MCSKFSSKFSTWGKAWLEATSASWASFIGALQAFYAPPPLRGGHARPPQQQHGRGRPVRLRQAGEVCARRVKKGTRYLDSSATIFEWTWAERIPRRYTCIAICGDVSEYMYNIICSTRRSLLALSRIVWVFIPKEISRCPSPTTCRGQAPHRPSEWSSFDGVRILRMVVFRWKSYEVVLSGRWCSVELRGNLIV
jgi:hypothetical protein